MVTRNLLMSVTSLLISFNATAAPNFDKMATQVISTLKNVKPEALCRKGDAFKGVFSLRSFEGELCKMKPFAIFASNLCSETSDFKSSKCFTNIKKIYPGLINASSEKIIEESVKILETPEGSKNKELICNKEYIEKLKTKVSKDYNEKRYSKIENMVEKCKEEGIKLDGIL